MTYRDSLTHLIAEQQRQRLNTQQEQLIERSLKEHTTQIMTINNQLIQHLKRELNQINGLHVQRITQFLKRL
jgi:hypothetical protein